MIAWALMILDNFGRPKVQMCIYNVLSYVYQYMYIFMCEHSYMYIFTRIVWEVIIQDNFGRLVYVHIFKYMYTNMCIFKTISVDLYMCTYSNICIQICVYSNTYKHI
jgi:hypothetical protein